MIEITAEEVRCEKCKRELVVIRSEGDILWVDPCDCAAYEYWSDDD